MKKVVIKIQIRTAYGRQLIYPMCKKAKLLVKLLGRKTFIEDDIPTLKALGYKIEVVQLSL